MIGQSLALATLLAFPGVPGADPLEAALNRFLGKDPDTFLANLEQSRPTAITTEMKTRVLASLPVEGEVRSSNTTARRKLAAVAPVLRLHGRDAIYEVKVIDVPQAFFGLHARTVVLISETALSLLDAEEVQAHVAHEVGHEYVWSQYQLARHRRESLLLQELELFCDGVAIVTLRQTGVDPARLISGHEKIIRYNREHFGWADNEDSYPSLTVRKMFASEIMHWLER